MPIKHEYFHYKYTKHDETRLNMTKHAKFTTLNLDSGLKQLFNKVFSCLLGKFKIHELVLHWLYI